MSKTYAVVGAIALFVVAFALGACFGPRNAGAAQLPPPVAAAAPGTPCVVVTIPYVEKGEVKFQSHGECCRQIGDTWLCQ
jgi:hypothetical protein